MFYAKKAAEINRVEEFKKLLQEFPEFSLDFPNKEKAPWHVRLTYRGSGPYIAVVNVWPHKAKAQREGFMAITSWPAVVRLLEQIVEEDGYGEGC